MKIHRTNGLERIGGRAAKSIDSARATTVDATHRSRPAALIGSAAVTFACGLACVASSPPPVFRVSQSAVAPIPTLASHHEFAGAADLSVGGSALSGASPSSTPPDGDTLSTPTYHVEGGLGLHILDGLSVRPFMFNDFGPTRNVGTGGPAPLASSVWGGGLGIGGRALFSDGRLNLDVGVDVGAMSIPTVQQLDCVANCTGGAMIQPPPTNETMFLGALGVGIGYAPVPIVRLTTSVTVRTQPMLLSSYESTTVHDLLTMGAVGVAGLNIDVRPVDAFAIVGSLELPFGATQVAYGPIVGLSLRYVIGSHALAARHRRTPDGNTPPPTLNRGEQQLAPIEVQSDAPERPAVDRSIERY